MFLEQNKKPNACLVIIQILYPMQSWLIWNYVARLTKNIVYIGKYVLWLINWAFDIVYLYCVLDGLFHICAYLLIVCSRHELFSTVSRFVCSDVPEFVAFRFRVRLWFNWMLLYRENASNMVSWLLYSIFLSIKLLCISHW